MNRSARHRARKAEANPQKKRSTVSVLFPFFLVALFFLVWGSWALPVTDPVESNYALTAREMVLSGNWMSPQIYHTFWYDKPIMVYWMLSAAYSLFGFTDFASRLPAALCGSLSSVLLVYYVFRITRDNVIALWAGVMLTLSLEFWVVSHAIITDSMLLLFTIPTLLSGYIAVKENSTKHFMIAYGGAALACLSKGPVGLVLPGLLLVLWCCSMKSPKLILRLFPWQGIAVFLLICLPWYAGMYLIHGSDFISQFLGIHNVLRATSSEHPEDNHFYYYLLLTPLALLPWTGSSFYEMVKGWKEKTDLYRFLMVWCWGTVLFYTLMATKYVTYTYIAVVPAIILAAFSAPKIRRGEKDASLALAASFLIFLTALTAGTFFLKDGSWWIFYLIVLYALWALLFRWKKNTGKRLTVIASVTASLFLCVITEGLPRYLPTRSVTEAAPVLAEAGDSLHFFRSYPAGYTFYTGNIADRVVPSVAEEERNPLWNEKYVMPSVQDTDFLADAARSEEAVYLFVSRSDSKYFARWDGKDRFEPMKPAGTGILYQYRKEELPSPEVSHE